jgi:hypothetical protein
MLMYYSINSFHRKKRVNISFIFPRLFDFFELAGTDQKFRMRAYLNLFELTEQSKYCTNMSTVFKY